jgi:prephenate dehydrogenase
MKIIDQLVLDENNIAFHPMMGNSYQLNEIAKEILVLLKYHKTKDEIVEELGKVYDISKKELFIDISDFLSKLKVYGIV